MFTESELLPLSGLQHLSFCERQWGLIHIEQLWAENRYTAEGRILHERADSAGGEARGEVRVGRGLAIRSLRLGLSGRADVVEFHRLDDVGASGEHGCRLPGRKGLWRPAPVEYKRGRPKSGPHDRIQVAAQAMCLEEMLETPVPIAYLFYGKNRRRTEVPVDDDLRKIVAESAARLHQLFEAGRTPAADYDPAKCQRCSLLDACMPRSASRKVRGYIQSSLAAMTAEEVE